MFSISEIFKRTPKPPIETIEKPRSLNEAETLNFLRSKGAENIQEFELGRPMLYVFEEKTKSKKGPFKDIAADRMPCFAIVHTPTKLDFNEPLLDDAFATGSSTEPSDYFRLENKGSGKVDFYAINPDTHEIIFIDSEYKSKDYSVKKQNLFWVPEGLVLDTETK